MDILRELPPTIKGFLDEEEGMGLYKLAIEAAGLGPCLEIGSYCGKSTVYLGTACREKGSVLFSIDHHRGSEEQQPGEEYYDPDLFDPDSGLIDTFKEFRRTIDGADLEDTVVAIVARSETAARQWSTPLGMVFIDGGHSIESAFADYNSWASHIVNGGFLAIHDIFPDPADGGQAPFTVYNIALSSGLFEARAMIKTLGILKRVEPGVVPDGLAV